MKNAILVFSGGPDSTAAALWAMTRRFNVQLLSFQFRSQQYGELFSAMKVAESLRLPHAIIDFKSPMLSFPPILSPLMHAGASSDRKPRSDSRRMLFGAGMVLGTACAYAIESGAQ